jgi:simple sugar transport system ATP-binding protein
MTDTTNGAAPPVPLIAFKGVSRRFGNNLAIEGLDFHVGRSEVVALLGDNGAGKSTVIKMMSGVLEPSEGTIECSGRPERIASYRDARRLGFETIYQDTGLVGELSIMRNMFLGRELSNRLGFLRKREMRDIAMDILEESVSIGGVDSPDRPVASLSGGQQQAVAIARAVHFRNTMMMLDEPTSALSVRETDSVLRYIRRLRDEGVSCVLVTHNVHHAFQVCDRFVVLSLGRKVLDVAREETSVEALTDAIIAVTH